MKMILLQICLVSLISFGSFARPGLTDWEATTPYGNKINNYGSVSLFLSDSIVENLTKWYFYKGYIIGLYNEVNQENFAAAYFIVNEQTLEINRYPDLNHWKLKLEQDKLVPFFYTRWYYTDWTFYDDQLLIFLIFGFFISIPLVILFILLMLRAIRIEKLNLKKPCTQVVIIISVFIFLHWISEAFPGSL